MSRTESTASDDSLQKIGSVGFLSGAILVAVGSLLLPPAAIPSANWQEALVQLSGKTQLFQLCALLLAFGYWAVMVGLVAVYRSIDGRAAAWAQVGFYFALLGTTMWTVGMSLDISYPAAIANWQAAPAATKDGAFILILAIPTFGRGLFPLEVIVIWLSYAMLGRAIVRSTAYCSELGQIGMILGIIGMLLGITQVFTGREASVVLYIALVGCTLLWWLAMGIWLARKAWWVRYDALPSLPKGA